MRVLRIGLEDSCMLGDSQLGLYVKLFCRLLIRIVTEFLYACV